MWWFILLVIFEENTNAHVIFKDTEEKKKCTRLTLHKRWAQTFSWHFITAILKARNISTKISFSVSTLTISLKCCLYIHKAKILVFTMDNIMTQHCASCREKPYGANCCFFFIERPVGITAGYDFFLSFPLRSCLQSARFAWTATIVRDRGVVCNGYHF